MKLHLRLADSLACKETGAKREVRKESPRRSRKCHGPTFRSVTISQLQVAASAICYREPRIRDLKHSFIGACKMCLEGGRSPGIHEANEDQGFLPSLCSAIFKVTSRLLPGFQTQGHWYSKWLFELLQSYYVLCTRKKVQHVPMTPPQATSPPF